MAKTKGTEPLTVAHDPELAPVAVKTSIGTTSELKWVLRNKW